MKTARRVRRFVSTPRGAAIGIASLFFLLYRVGLAPTVLWGDDAKFQVNASLLRLYGDPTSHPLYVMLASVFVRLPLGGDAAYRVNLTSALYGACALYFVFRIAHYLSGSLWAGAAASISLGISQTFWLFAERAAPHTLNAAFLAGLLWGILRWDGREAKLWLGAFLYGLSLVNHLLMGFALPGYLWLLYPTARRRGINLRAGLGTIIAAVLGVFPLVVITLQDNTTRANTSAMIGTLSSMLQITTPTRDLVLWLSFLACQFVGPALILGTLGAGRVWRENRQIAVGLVLLYLGDVAFAFDLKLPDQYKYYIPSYVIFSILVGIGLATVQGELTQRHYALSRRIALLLLIAMLVIPPPIYASTPFILRGVGITSLLGARNLPGRDSVTFHIWPPKWGYIGARQFAETAFAQMPTDSVLIIDWTPAAPMLYLQSVERQRLDVVLALTLPLEEQVPLALRYARSGRPLFLGNTELYYDVEGLARHFEIVPVGPIYRLIPR